MVEQKILRVQAFVSGRPWAHIVGEATVIIIVGQNFDCMKIYFNPYTNCYAFVSVISDACCGNCYRECGYREIQRHSMDDPVEDF